MKIGLVSAKFLLFAALVCTSQLQAQTYPENSGMERSEGSVGPEGSSALEECNGRSKFGIQQLPRSDHRIRPQVPVSGKSQHEADRVRY